MPPDGTDLALADLAPGRELGVGGQGKVYELRGALTGHVFKEYVLSGVDGAALKRLVDLPARLSGPDRDALLRQAAWPLARVLDGGAVKGFVMRVVPRAFWGNAATGPRLRELQYLLYRPKPMWGDIAPPDADGRLRVARNTAGLFRLLHGHGLIVGDVSMKNLLWSPAGEVFLLDCDGVRELGERPVLPQTHTPDWNDPREPPTGPELDTDRYKLALLVARVLTRTHALRPGDEVGCVPGLPDRVVAEVTARFAEAGRARGLRPDAAQWARALDDRGVIQLAPLPPVRRPPKLPKVPLDGAGGGGRPTIRLRPPEN
ncbi:hypothetical protein ACFHW2_22775 [Actinomadura sp. LOL_016]|uniref:hypothetical protein n=1 Tax=unclassified Actinomadura TaxID=2626254 RepID=UPI003A7FBF72